MPSLVQNQQAYIDSILPAAHAFKDAVTEALNADNAPAKNTTIADLRAIKRAVQDSLYALAQIQAFILPTGDRLQEADGGSIQTPFPQV